MRIHQTRLFRPAFGWWNARGNVKLILLYLFVCAYLVAAGVKVHAQEALLDYQVKAAMIYKFLGYSTWPDNRFESTQSPYRIWVIGSDDIKNELMGIVVNRLIDGRPIEIYSAKTIDQIGDAHLVFVARKMEPVLPTLASRARESAFIIVTENEAGLVNGSTINLRLIDDRIRFEISLLSAQENGIALSSRLLALAITVIEERD